MKTLISALLFISLNAGAQYFDFYNSIYWTPVDGGSGQGTELISSGTNLSTFNFTFADPLHPLFVTGIYYPVQDCAGHNLWIQVQHIATDPNGTDVGQNITTTLNSPFQPQAASDRIGGWNGFLYEFSIYIDEVEIGTRNNILESLYPIPITVSSLETLFNNGGFNYELVTFEILTNTSTGWFLNSTNFTGINPNSNPGFSGVSLPATTGDANNAPTGFSTDFPSGYLNVYAVDMNLSGGEHSEFKMSASGVSVFRYGYEMADWGYQGMGMEFGIGPVVDMSVVNPICAGSNDGSINLQVVGTAPITLDWVGGSELTADGLAPGSYTVLVTDGNGCTITTVANIVAPAPLNATVAIEDQTILTVVPTGGIWPYTYEWMTGETTQTIQVGSADSYWVEVTDGNGCTYMVVFPVGIEEVYFSGVEVYPVPAEEFIVMKAPQQIKEVRIFDAAGKLVIQHAPSSNTKQIQLDVDALHSGVYTYQLLFGNDHFTSGKMAIR